MQKREPTYLDAFGQVRPVVPARPITEADIKQHRALIALRVVMEQKRGIASRAA